ncbi:MAG: C_GCAxxG_C_C family protein [Erysipelotrichaceae bacterium]|nr:C_GCAxxG_C_C family protein [Erysipelotrichaceae bacterium]
MNRSEQAVYNKHHGYNCSQSVLSVFEEGLPLDAEQLRALGSCFCAGMGSTEGTCGALVAAEMILGMRKYCGRPQIAESREVFEAFRKESGATVCSDLKGLKTGRVLCSCDRCIEIAVKLLEERFKDEDALY